MSLFNYGDFELHAGGASKFLINCEVLTDDDLDALAKVVATHMVPFSSVYGIPRGGVRFAEALKPYASQQKRHPILIADDVYTTGSSMNEAKEELKNFDVMGLVIFSRSPTPSWIKSLFQGYEWLK